jgi:hypothetical protein
MQLTRLTQAKIKQAREQLAEAQGQRCALCKLPLSKPVLDHDHSTGVVRATLHSGCNALLGKVENNYRRYGVINLAAFLHGTAEYLQRHSTPQTAWLHHLYRTADEKRERTNTKARAARAARKASE